MPPSALYIEKIYCLCYNIERKDKADKKLAEYIFNPDKLTEDVNKAKEKSDEANIINNDPDLYSGDNEIILSEKYSERL